MIELSLIVPAYNEEQRLSPFLARLARFFGRRKDYELILVNDGSKDKTIEIMQNAARKNTHIKIITYGQNRGKGYAVRRGVLAAKGKKIMFIDADGSIGPDEIPKMEKSLEYYDFVWGNRSNRSSNTSQPAIRKITSSLFNPYVELLFGNRIADNLCGFKGFKRNAAKLLFTEMKSNNFIFDVELFTLARRNKLAMSDIPLEWHHKDGSKMSIITPFKMGLQLMRLKLRMG